MEYTLLYPLILSLILTLILMPLWIKKCRQTGMLWEDMNKPDHPKNVASSGGIVVITGFVLGVLVFIALRTFIIKSSENSLAIFAILTSILFLAVIGLVDDLLGWKNGGLSKNIRIFLIVLSAIPLIVINAGYSIMSFPLIGEIDLGIWYILFFIPLGITGATATYNFLAGLNGLEASQGIIILSYLSFIAYVTGSPWLSIIGMCMVFSLIGFYIFNKYPASVFPGDILTYSVGALIAIMSILGNFEKIAVFVFIPYILETILKLRGNLKNQSFGKPNDDGSLDLLYDKFYSLNHVGIYILKKFKNKVYEKDVVYLINLFQIIIIILSYFLFKQSIYN